MNATNRDLRIALPPARALRVGAAVLALLLAACSSAPEGTPAGTCRLAAPCPPDWLQFTDSSCSPPIVSIGPGCTSNGDGLCYRRCFDGVDCIDRGFPVCGSITVYGGSDVGRPVSVCLSRDPVPACQGPGDAGPDGQDAASAYHPTDGDRD